jgi:hypothetical protein
MLPGVDPCSYIHTVRARTQFLVRHAGAATMGSDHLERPSQSSGPFHNRRLKARAKMDAGAEALSPMLFDPTVSSLVMQLASLTLALIVTRTSRLDKALVAQIAE